MTEPYIRTQYQMITLDPPWPETGGGGRGAQNHYGVIKKKEHILQSIIDSGVFLPADNCHMCLWITNNYLLWGTWLMKELGFTYKTMVTWPKESFGTGYYFPGQTEHFLFGVRGTLMPRNRDGKFSGGSTLLKVKDDPSKYANAHSRKPEEFYDACDGIGYRPRLEMFCRTPHPNWDAWGLDESLNTHIADAGVGVDTQMPTQKRLILPRGHVIRADEAGLTTIVRA